MRVQHCAKPARTLIQLFNWVGTAIAVLLLLWALAYVFAPIASKSLGFEWGNERGPTEKEEQRAIDHHPDVLPP